MSGVKTVRKVIYPSADGKPMAETDVHWLQVVTATRRLKRFFAGQNAYVASDLLLYYEQGNPRKSVAPDTFVVKNCKPGNRRTFLVWKERRRPNFILETTSKSTRKTDDGPKKHKYALLRVKEYFLFDPFGEWLDPPLQGFRLVKGEYVRITPDAEGGVVSQELGIRFVVENGSLAMFNAATGERLLTDEEWERQRADAAEEELGRLKESIRRLNGHKYRNGE